MVGVVRDWSNGRAGMRAEGKAMRAWYLQLAGPYVRSRPVGEWQQAGPADLVLGRLSQMGLLGPVGPETIGFGLEGKWARALREWAWGNWAWPIKTKTKINDKK